MGQSNTQGSQGMTLCLDSVATLLNFRNIYINLQVLLVSFKADGQYKS